MICKFDTSCKLAKLPNVLSISTNGKKDGRLTGTPTAWNGLMAATLCRLYLASGKQKYLEAAKRADCFLWEKLWDCMPGGNSLMAWNLVRLSQLVSEERYGPLAKQQLDFLAADAKQYPAGYAMFLLALLDYRDPPPKVTVVLAGKAEAERLPLELPAEAAVVVREPGEGSPLKDGVLCLPGP